MNEEDPLYNEYVKRKESEINIDEDVEMSQIKSPIGDE